MQHVVSNLDPDAGYGKQGSMAVTLTAIDTVVFVDLALPDKWGGMVGYQDVIGIPQYNMIVKDGLKGYADQAAMP